MKHRGCVHNPGIFTCDTVRKTSHCLIMASRLSRKSSNDLTNVTENLRSESNQIDYQEIVQGLEKNAEKRHKHTRTYEIDWLAVGPFSITIQVSLHLIDAM